MKKKLLQLGLILLLTPAILLAGGIKGYVKDASTNQPLIGASIVVKGTTNGVVTDINGYFEIYNIQENEQVIIASYVGYVPDSTTVNLESRENVSHTFLLTSESVAINDVVVVGQALGQFSAINQQLRSNAISNIVSSEKIRQLPDANVAESVGRLPGVALESDQGEGSKVIVRGLQPRFNQITINGVRAPSSSHENTSVSMAGISPFMIDGIEVQKSLTPDKDADVIGGIVDLKLKNADQGFHANALVQNRYPGKLPGNKINPFATLQVSNRFFNNKLGLVLVGSYEKVNRISHEANNSVFGLIEDENEPVKIRRGTSRFEHGDIERERKGANAFIDYNTEGFKLQASAFVNILTDQANTRNYSLSDRWDQTKAINVRELNSLSSVYSLKLEKDIYNTKLNVGLSYNNAKNETPANYTATTKNLIFAATPEQYPYIYAIEEMAHISTITQTPNYTNYELGRLLSNVKKLPGTELISDSAYYISELRSQKSIFTENSLIVNFDYQVPVSFGSKINGFIKTGAKYTSKNREYDARNFFAGTADGTPGISFANDIRQNILPDLNFNDNAEIVGGSDRLAPYHLYGNFEEIILDGGYTLKGFMSPENVRKILSAIDDANWTISESATQESNKRGDDYFGSEAIIAGFLMTDLNITSYVKLVGGFRYERMQTEYQAFGTFATGSGTSDLINLEGPVGKRENDYLLPMVNTKIMPFDWMDIRLAYTHSIARPQYTSFVPGFEVNSNKELYGTGNPELTPALSENFDAYLTFNTNKLGLFTLGGFFKRIDNFEYYRGYKTKNPVAIEKLNILLEKYDPYLLTKSRLNGDYSNLRSAAPIPINNPFKAFVKGAEVDFQTSFWYLPKPLNGITLSANYTFTESEQTETIEKIDSLVRDPRGFVIKTIYKDSSYTTTLHGQPKHIFNASFGYDIKGFSVRVSFRHTQEAFIGRLGHLNVTEDRRIKATHQQWDLSLTQQIPWVKGLQLFINASNFTNQIQGDFVYLKAPGEVIGFSPEKSVAQNKKDRYPLLDKQYSNFFITGIKYSF